MKQQELRNIIEKGVVELESIAYVKWQADRFKLSRDKFILAVENSLVENTSMWETAKYKNAQGFSRAMNKIVLNIPNREKCIYWQKYILQLVNYKQCSNCKKIKTIDSFYVDINNKDGKRGHCKDCCIIYNKNNKEKRSERDRLKRKETAIHIINVMIREGKLIECSECGYKENWAALDFHHINPNLERPEWAKNKHPSDYIFSKGKNVAEERYLYEIDNLELLCRNCHTNTDTNNTKDNQKGLKDSLHSLGYDYICILCNKETNLELHHNMDNKNTSFRDFNILSKKRIISDGILQKEMEKDVSILCGNHHREIHNPKWKLPINIEE